MLHRHVQSTEYNVHVNDIKVKVLDLDYCFHHTTVTTSVYLLFHLDTTKILTKL